VLKNLFAFCVVFSMGCISAQGKRTTFVDYFPVVGEDMEQGHSSDKSQARKKRMQKYTEKGGHDLTFARAWSYALNNELKGKRYTGARMTLTDPDMFFRFGISVFMSPTITTYNDRGFGPEPEKRAVILKDSYLSVLTMKQEVFFVISPSLTAPLIRYDLDLRLGSRLVVHTNVELRSGIGYEWRIPYKHSVSDIYVLGDELQDVYLPSNISSRSYLSQVNTFDINIRPVHFEIGLTFNRNEHHLSLGIGAVW